MGHARGYLDFECDHLYHSVTRDVDDKKLEREKERVQVEKQN